VPNYCRVFNYFSFILTSIKFNITVEEDFEEAAVSLDVEVETLFYELSLIASTFSLSRNCPSPKYSKKPWSLRVDGQCVLKG
jgi:hypothetical protein